jgi:AraC-like DNA-binding protein
MLTERDPLQVPNEHQACVDEVRRYVRAYADQPLNRKLLADVAGFSVPHLHRIFTATTGESVVSYVRRMRMLRAGRKLRMGAVDIMAVALAAGYASHAAFSKAFKQQFGLSPSEFRQLDCAAATALLRRIESPEDHAHQYPDR